jgi:hypothetical protein
MMRRAVRESIELAVGILIVVPPCMLAVFGVVAFINWLAGGNLLW